MISREEKLSLARNTHRKYRVMFEWPTDNGVLKFFRGLEEVDEKVIYTPEGFIHYITFENMEDARRCITIVESMGCRGLELTSCLVAQTDWVGVDI